MDAAIAYFHFLSIIATGAFLIAELLLVRRELTLAQARLLLKVDIYFFASALVALGTGLLRVFWAGKGAAFYIENPLFWTKVGLYMLIALLSIIPTMHYQRWRPEIAAGRAPRLEDASVRRVRRVLLIEVHLFVLMPLLAVLMARGVGL